MALTRMMDITVKTEGVENVKSVIVHYDYLFSYYYYFYFLFFYYFYFFYFFYILTAFIISQYSAQWGRLHFATFMCNINYKFIYYANLSFFLLFSIYCHNFL